MHDIMGLEAAIDFHLELGPERVRDRCQTLTRRFRDGVSGFAKLEIVDTHIFNTEQQVDGLLGALEEVL